MFTILIFHVLIDLKVLSLSYSVESLLSNWTVSDNNSTFKHGASGSMIAFDSNFMMIYIFGGYHDHDSILELYGYDIITNELKPLSCNTSFLSHSSSLSIHNDISPQIAAEPVVPSPYQPSSSSLSPNEDENETELNQGRTNGENGQNSDDPSLRSSPSESDGITITNKGNHSVSINNNSHDHCIYNYYSNVVTNSVIINNKMYFATSSGLHTLDILNGILLPPLIYFNDTELESDYINDKNYVNEPCIIQNPKSHSHKFLILDLRSDGNGIIEYDTYTMNISSIFSNRVKLHHDHIQGILFILSMSMHVIFRAA